MSECMHQIIVSCLIRNDMGKVLLVRHYKRGWELPQGRVEEGESVIDALHREIAEETGVKIVSPALAAVWSKLTPPPALIVTFAARHASGEPRPSDETPEVEWFCLDEIFDYVRHPINRDRIRAVLDFSGQPSFHSYTTGPYRILASIDESTRSG